MDISFYYESARNNGKNMSVVYQRLNDVTSPQDRCWPHSIHLISVLYSVSTHTRSTLTSYSVCKYTRPTLAAYSVSKYTRPTLAAYSVCKYTRTIYTSYSVFKYTRPTLASYNVSKYTRSTLTSVSWHWKNSDRWQDRTWLLVLIVRRTTDWAIEPPMFLTGFI